MSSLALAVPFAPDHKWDRNFSLAFICLCWLGVFMGFAPAVTGRLQNKADYVAPLILHIHAAAFVGWMVLLTTQILLIRLKRTSVHKTLGLISLLLIPVMAVSAILSEVYSQRFYLTRNPANLQFFIIPIFYILAFTPLASAAIWFRKDSSAHKRLILLATTVIVGAAYGRWWGESLFKLFGEGFWGEIILTYTGTNFLLALALAYDWITRRQVHRVYAIAVPLLLISQLIVSFVYHNPAWPPVAKKLIGY